MCAVTSSRPMDNQQAEEEVAGDAEPLEGAPDLLPLDSMLDLFNWYDRNLCRPEIRDCRGNLVEFRHEDFIHLIKLTDRYQKEPKHRGRAVQQIRAGELKIFHGSKHWPANFERQRARELSAARTIIESPWMIVPNWQPMGKANPGEAYIGKFGSDKRPRYRVLICAIAGKTRMPVTIFPRERFKKEELAVILWAK